MNYYYINNLGDDGKFIEDDLSKAVYSALRVEDNLYFDTGKGWKRILDTHENNEFNFNMLK